eukprot:TRINITY_DN14387_c0_g1_i2.p1 TRINITY_DN14387_c0_g1~~TRINITY_DN14387_c0_g1_i2.p1  ORF type:complete len:207 (+),score=41.49 TRINITY_DN14387_c0_g1_i2:245-865(+)
MACSIRCVLLSLWALRAWGCQFADIAGYRSDAVKKSFDLKLMDGFWYEHAEKDPAQVGASCQTLNITCDVAAGTMKSDFSVLYGSHPFTIVENYKAPAKHGHHPRGVFGKSVEEPGGSLILLPSVIVDAKLSADGSRYDSFVMHSCFSALGVAINELIVATRNPQQDDETVQSMIESAQKHGVPTEGVKMVDRSKCGSKAVKDMIV